MVAMRFLVLSGNPKETGLCMAATEAAIQGARDGGAKVILAEMDRIARCQVCGDGWGTCLNDHKCVYEDDDFKDVQALLHGADAIALITPVYWGECAEGLKAFIDRLRRCENKMRRAEGEGALNGKPALLVASPGGSGNGALTCLSQLERFCQHTGANVFDMIVVNRWNSDYMRKAVYAAAHAIVDGRKHGETVPLA